MFRYYLFILILLVNNFQSIALGMTANKKAQSDYYKQVLEHESQGNLTEQKNAALMGASMGNADCMLKLVEMYQEQTEKKLSGDSEDSVNSTIQAAYWLQRAYECNHGGASYIRACQEYKNGKFYGALMHALEGSCPRMPVATIQRASTRKAVKWDAQKRVWVCDYLSAPSEFNTLTNHPQYHAQSLFLSWFILQERYRVKIQLFDSDSNQISDDTVLELETSEIKCYKQALGLYKQGKYQEALNTIQLLKAQKFAPAQLLAAVIYLYHSDAIAKPWSGQQAFVDQKKIINPWEEVGSKLLILAAQEVYPPAVCLLAVRLKKNQKNMIAKFQSILEDLSIFNYEHVHTVLALYNINDNDLFETYTAKSIECIDIDDIPIKNYIFKEIGSNEQSMLAHRYNQILRTASSNIEIQKLVHNITLLAAQNNPHAGICLIRFAKQKMHDFSFGSPIITQSLDAVVKRYFQIPGPICTNLKLMGVMDCVLQHIGVLEQRGELAKGSFASASFFLQPQGNLPNSLTPTILSIIEDLIKKARRCQLVQEEARIIAWCKEFGHEKLRRRLGNCKNTRIQDAAFKVANGQYVHPLTTMPETLKTILYEACIKDKNKRNMEYIAWRASNGDCDCAKIIGKQLRKKSIAENNIQTLNMAYHYLLFALSEDPSAQFEIGRLIFQADAIVKNSTTKAAFEHLTLENPGYGLASMIDYLLEEGHGSYAHALVKVCYQVDENCLTLRELCPPKDMTEACLLLSHSALYANLYTHTQNILDMALALGYIKKFLDTKYLETTKSSKVLIGFCYSIHVLKHYEINARKNQEKLPLCKNSIEHNNKILNGLSEKCAEYTRIAQTQIGIKTYVFMERKLDLTQKKYLIKKIFDKTECPLALLVPSIGILPKFYVSDVVMEEVEYLLGNKPVIVG